MLELHLLNSICSKDVTVGITSTKLSHIAVTSSGDAEHNIFRISSFLVPYLHKVLAKPSQSRILEFFNRTVVHYKYSYKTLQELL